MAASKIFTKRRISPSKGWALFARHHRGGKPSPLIRRAVKALGSPKVTGRIAVDLGCGPGRDALFLAYAGFRTLAVDSNREALRLLKAETPAALRSRIRPVLRSMARVKLPKADLIHAVRSLPFLPRKDFTKVMRSLPRLIPAGGIFSGIFFGPRDDWAKGKSVVAVPKGELRKLFRGFTILELKERRFRGRTSLGQMKNWHELSVIARRR